MMRLNHLANQMLDGLIAQPENHPQSILRDFLVFAADAIAGPIVARFASGPHCRDASS
jgi:hypothetical protein